MLSCEEHRASERCRNEVTDDAFNTTDTRFPIKTIDQVPELLACEKWSEKACLGRLHMYVGRHWLGGPG